MSNDTIELEEATSEEIAIVVERGFTSMDFEFVSFALAYGNPKVEVRELIPTESGSSRRNEGPPKFVFVLLGRGEEWYERLKELHYSYMNGKCLIDPTKLNAQRRGLRSLIFDKTNEKKEFDKKGK